MAVKRIRIRRDTSANWAFVNPVLALGEIGIATDVKRKKVGDGATLWNALPYVDEYFELKTNKLTEWPPEPTDDQFASAKLIRDSLATKQAALGYIPENIVNKVITRPDILTDTQYPSAKLVFESLDEAVGDIEAALDAIIGEGFD